MRFGVNTVNITALTSELFLLIGCAGTLTEEETYERHEAYIQMVNEYNNEVRRCRRARGSMVSSGSWTRNYSGNLSAEQMSSARCVSRR